MKKADAVFEGGGVKGLGLVGALTVAEENGYTDWRRVVGTSAGAIVASLLAAGYSAEELKEILMDLEYSELLYYTRPRDVLFHPIGFFVPFQDKCQGFADSKDTTFAPSRLNNLS